MIAGLVPALVLFGGIELREDLAQALQPFQTAKSVDATCTCRLYRRYTAGPDKVEQTCRLRIVRLRKGNWIARKIEASEPSPDWAWSIDGRTGNTARIAS